LLKARDRGRKHCQKREKGRDVPMPGGGNAYGNTTGAGKEEICNRSPEKKRKVLGKRCCSGGNRVG